MTPPERGIATLDNITAVGLFSDDVWDALRRGVLDTEGRPEIGSEGGERLVRGERSSPERPLRQVFHLADGTHVQIDLSAEGAKQNHWRPDRDNGCCCRIEFNPNKADHAVLGLLAEMEVDHVTRADVALDYPGVSVGGLAAYLPYARSDTCRRGEGGETQTIQIGKRASRRHLVVYDKLAELGIAEPGRSLTRVESRHRFRPSEDPPLGSDMLDGLRVVNRSVPEGLSLSDRLRWSAAVNDPGLFADVREHDKARIRALMADRPALDPDPVGAYGEQRERLLDELGDVLAGRTFGLVAEVYRRG